MGIGRSYRTLLYAFLAVLAFVCVTPAPSLARSVYTPRDSGTEPPGGPRAPEGLPQSGSFGRTPEGGMGYTDAYGNTISNVPPERKARRRLPQGAFGRYESRESSDRPLPDPMVRSAHPVWSFK